MGRTKGPERVNLHTTISKNIHDRWTLELFSETEGRVPQGAWQELIEGMLLEKLQQLDAARRAAGGVV